MNFTEEQYSQLKNIWKYQYPSEKTFDKWLKWISNRGEDKNIQKINQTLNFFKDNNIDFKDDIIALFHSQSNFHVQLPNFSYFTIFNFLKTNHLATDAEIPMDNMINGFNYYSRKSRFQLDNQIKFILLFTPEEKLINQLLSSYTTIHKEYTLDLPTQKKIIKIFNNYALNFVKTLDNSKQETIFKQIDFICSGLNNESVKDISISHDEDFSFRFTISVNNGLTNALKEFNNLKDILNYIVEKMPKDNISNIIFKEINTQTKLGVLKFQYAFFSNDKSYNDQYSAYFKEFNTLLVTDSLNKSLSTPVYYLELFNKICFKNKLLNKFEEKNQKIKNLKI